MDVEVSDTQGLPFAAWYKPAIGGPAAGRPAVGELRVGDLCPRCSVGKMDYDGLLNLACSYCGYSLSGGAGCT